MALKDALDQLSTSSHVAIHSTAELAGAVAQQAAKEDKKRREIGQPDLPRKHDLKPVRSAEHQHGFRITPWEILQTFGRATTLSGHSPSRGLSQHWNCLRYLTTLEARGGRMTLSTEARQNPRYYNKGVQAQELGIAFALTAARKILECRHPGYRFEAVDVDLALDAGWALRGAGTQGIRPARGYRPGQFLVGRKPGEPLRIVLVDGRGSHGDRNYQHQQLRTSAERVEVIALGDRHGQPKPVPSLLMTTAFAAEAGIEMRMLDPAGDGVLASPGGPSADVHGAVAQVNNFPDIQWTEQGRTVSRPGFHLTPDRFEWFSRVLVRARAASLLTFVGDRQSAAQYLTERQQLRLGKDHAPYAVNAECDVSVTLGGVELVGTDHVFRFEGQRVEVFSGIPKDLYELLTRDGGTRNYADQVAGAVADWKRRLPAIQADWDGIATIDGDGAVMALRPLGGKGPQLKSSSPRPGL
ncbi:hypothetical protein [Amycolatopsis sp. NPDC051903]|uniref:hypothetical protein n=1 Tax=Amycolatopsis sp. NPDC051903 TaxID=3363936 RepID=UPI00378B8E96